MVMQPHGAVRTAKRFLDVVCLAVFVPAVAFFFVIMVLTTVDVILRWVANQPLSGVLDLTMCMMLALAWLGAPWVMIKEKHINIDIVFNWFPPRVQAVMAIITSLLSIGFFGIVAWIGTVYAVKSRLLDAHLETLRAIPVFPLRFFIALGAALLVLALVAHVFKNANKAVKGVARSAATETKD